MDVSDLLDQLAGSAGIEPAYDDIWGGRRLVPQATKRALLAAMDLAAGSDAELKAHLADRAARSWRRLLPPVLVARAAEGPPQIPLSIPAAWTGERFAWRLELESGETHEGAIEPVQLERLEERRLGEASFVRCAVGLPLAPGPGYHWFELTGSGEAVRAAARMRLIMAPARCYQPAAIAGGKRVWGWTVQLYGLRSERNWGIGDFTDLKGLVELVGQVGADIVGVNPLHALFPANPAHASPYNPSSRSFLNVLYLDPEATADFAECEPARDLVRSTAFQARLRALRAAELVDYEGVAAAKLEVLGMLYRHFRERHLARDSERSRAFCAFRAERGRALATLALFDALHARFRREAVAHGGWPSWPEAFRDPSSAEASAYAAAHQEEVELYEYLQWQAELQLGEVGRRSRELGLAIGLYQDLALGVDAAGADTWSDPPLYATGAAIGAPPDDFNPQGQNWGLPPMISDRLAERAYEPFIAALRAGMRHSGALRIDHVMGLLRLYWVPAGATPENGAYVSYPLGDLLGILALESERNRCLVIGEDLGTVPSAIRGALQELGVLSYRLLYFEKEADGSFRAPAAYPVDALVAVTTHDLPTLRGFWLGRDLDVRQELALYPSQALREAQLVARAQDRARLLVALEKQGLLPEGARLHPVAHPDLSSQLARALHVFVARTPAKVMVVQPEDVLGQVEQANLPGSTAAHPNWRRKLALNLELWLQDERVRAFIEALQSVRCAARAVPQEAAAPAIAARQAVIPLATYRLQFSRDLTLLRAAELVPYLDALGISHCYASPFLKARPGSPHGYDIVDHNVLDPEIGSREDLEHFVRELRRRGMGLVLDIVPNHMGVLRGDNAWWLDVLENGRASLYASFFDIDWEPQRRDLRGRVLLPVLGAHYGEVLDGGELRLAFDGERGELGIRYADHRFPLDPKSYPRVLGRRLAELEARLGAASPALGEFQSLVSAFEHLPPCDAVGADAVAERNRDKEILKRRLAALCAQHANIAHFVGENVTLVNGDRGDPASFEALHELLELQPYRLAYWRVASDEINYRRFFDINDLAGLRVEDEPVFLATHRLVFDLLARGWVDGLRIDHPDGLYDPRQYVTRLQRHAAAVENARDAPVEAPGKPVYMVLEKILADYERLPQDWPVHGTTGYRFANVVNGLFVDATGRARLDRFYRSFTGETDDFEEIVYRSKRVIVGTALASELNVLANQLSRIASADRRTRDFTLNSLRDALIETVTCFPVYRTYIAPDRVAAEDKRYIDWASAVAKKRSRAADATVFDFVRDVLTTEIARGKAAGYRAAVTAFAMKFQQYTGPVMAKGVEDTGFYIFHRLVSLNEVGGDPRRFGMSVAALHAASQDRAKTWPHTMLATSTHDTKRSEDVRARINVISEMPAVWRLALRRWSRMNRAKRSEVDGQPVPSRNDEYLLYQTLIGIWPPEGLDQRGLDDLRSRLEQYMLKAAREAKVHTSWINPNAAYEQALTRYIELLLGSLDKNLFLGDFVPAAKRIARYGMLNSLSQALIKIASPGVPDFYQGTELWAPNLVDPDNRGPVDFRKRGDMLRELQEKAGAWAGARAELARELMATMQDGRIKLYLTWKALNERRALRAVFESGEYLPLAAEGAKAEHVFAFGRRAGARLAIVLAPRLYARLTDDSDADPLGEEIWRDTRVEISPTHLSAAFVDVFTGSRIALHRDGKRGWLRLAQALVHFPVALLLDA